MDHSDCDAQRNHLDVLHWDASCLPLQDSSVDIIITDLVSSTHVTSSDDSYLVGSQFTVCYVLCVILNLNLSNVHVMLCN